MRADDGTSAAATLQVQFGAGLFSLNLFGKFNLAFSIKHFHRADVFQIPRTSAMQTVSGY